MQERAATLAASASSATLDGAQQGKTESKESEERKEGEPAAAAGGAASGAGAGESKDGEGEGKESDAPESSAAKAAAVAALGAGGAPGGESGQLGFYDIISNKEEILELMISTINGSSTTSNELSKNRQRWSVYSGLWDRDRAQFLQRLQLMRERVSSRMEVVGAFDRDIDQYRTLESDIRGEEPTETIDFVKVDNSLLKERLLELKDQWQQSMLQLLHDQALAELREVQAFVDDNQRELAKQPETLLGLLEMSKRLQRCRADLSSYEERFAPLDSMYRLLGKYQFQLSASEKAQKDGLSGKWDGFHAALDRADDDLRRLKSAKKKDLQDSLQKLAQDVAQLKKEAQQQLPYNIPTGGLQEASETLRHFRTKVEQARRTEAELGPGLEVFEIPSAEPPELVEVEGELENLNKLWDIRREYDASWEEWQKGQFLNLDPERLEAEGLKFKQRVGKMREFRRWGIWTSVDQDVRNFLQTMPLISDLGNPSLRERHWAELKEEVHAEFDERSGDFTLGAVQRMGFFKHSDFIGELSARATREKKIEDDLDEILRIWGDTNVDVFDYKEHYKRIAPSEELQQQLENDLGTLSMIKGSKFYPAFKSKVDGLEHQLSLVGEVLDLQMQVQRAWMYLESIFMSSPDIRRQLQRESELFDDVNENYVEVGDQMAAEPNAIKACCREGHLDRLTKMDEQLEEI